MIYPHFDMDQILKARKMGSALARRRKMQEREIAMQQDEEKRTKILLYGCSSEEDESSDGEGNSYPLIPDTQSDRLQPTSSISTSNNSTAPSEQKRASSLPFLSSLPSNFYIPELVISPSLSPDFAAHLPELLLPSDDADESFFSDPETPIEIATPILYSIPHCRPSMISIKTPNSQTSPKAPQRPASMPHPPPVPIMSDKRVSAISLRSSSSPVELPIMLLPSFSQDIPNNVRRLENGVSSRPVDISVYSPSTLQYRVPTYDVFPRRSKIASSRRSAQPAIREEQAQMAPAAIPQIVVNARRTTSYPPVSKDAAVRINSSPPAQLSTRKSTLTLRQRRPSIGLALRNASAPFRSKNTSGRPATSSSSESTGSKDGIDFSDFPMPPPSPLLQQSFREGRLSPERSGGGSRISRVRSTIGL
jgi:hypothetical protein